MPETTGTSPSSGDNTSAQPKSGFWAEIESLKTPAVKDVAPAPKVGSPAPSTAQIPLPDGRKTLVVFLRHCGCPFAEKTFKSLTAISDQHKDDLHCVAVSHSSAEATERWVPQVGGAWQTDVVVDEGRDVYAKWGLGLSSAWHAFNPFALYSVYRLGADEGIWNRPTESGSRWQTSGAFAVDADGTIRWAHVSSAANDLPDFNAALDALGIEPKDEQHDKHEKHHHHHHHK
ncbi:thioredoxin-like fold protein [Purpureocillium lilacinum]|nr:thioredoxin-like fold protein [Purpureocillium lilacinum]OAQ80446.1 thioredoxin-like fold protein [Purpureocillium lilacinum]OAQ88147.1 thioredoxin-like fold protein [Purpureocillium lilacinum]GJN75072.1 hypothetical protein PLICBS_009168 [Purpureocillium lilacinum]GJN85194.1 hypothetical protein PLIIFM63780_008758 [Purpureocillium lilacinum]